jgi:broad-specificity NMP kinase
LRSALIVVGAGSINYKPAHEWYLRQNMISLTGDPQIIYGRGSRQGFHKNKIENYVETEFSDSRIYLYENSKCKINVTELEPEQVAELILKAIMRT